MLAQFMESKIINATKKVQIKIITSLRIGLCCLYHSHKSLIYFSQTSCEKNQVIIPVL